MLSNDETTVNALRRFVAMIDDARPLQRVVAFNAATWEPWLDHPDAALVLKEFGPRGTVGRQDLLALATAARSGAASEHVQLFVATMIWGSGTTNGRGPRYTHAALEDARLVDCLASTHALCHRMDYSSAYTTFRMNGVGPAFFTKWFWASTLGAELMLTPLILDDRVWRSLGSLGWDSRVAAGSRRWGDRYVAYLRALHQWATLIGVSPEELEWALFTTAGRSESD